MKENDRISPAKLSPFRSFLVKPNISLSCHGGSHQSHDDLKMVVMIVLLHPHSNIDIFSLKF
jgi:hypothetical protein